MDNFVESFYPTKFDKVLMETLSNTVPDISAGKWCQF